MVQESRFFGLPLLEVNPFSTRPLEAGDAGKLIGREEEFSLLRTYLKLGTARRIMLTGPLGSGRTSLVRCLKPYAGAFISIDHLPAQAPAQAMLEMIYQQLIGGSTLPERTELVNQLVTEMYAYTDKLPLVVIDVPASDFSVVDVALRDAHSSLERLNAVIVLVCDVRERNHLPATVVTGFERFILAPFSPTDVVDLVEHRLRGIGVSSSGFSLQDAETILESCSGYPSEVVATLRDAVDRIRIQHAEGVAPPHFDTSARLQPRDETQPLDALRSDAGLDTPGKSDLPASNNPVEDSLDDLPTYASDSIIDASLPWTERDDPNPTSTSSDGAEEAAEEAAKEAAKEATEKEVESTPTSSFDLDMDGLDREITNDEPLKPPKFSNDIIDASRVMSEGRGTPSGTFGNLVSRNKVSLSVADAIKADAKRRPSRLEDYSESTEWWVEEELPKPRKTPVGEDESAALIHDEIGLPLPESEAFPPEAVGEDHGRGSDVASPLDVQSGMEAPLQPQVPAGRAVDETVLNALLHLLTGEKNVGTTADVQHLMDFFASQRQMRLGEKESYALNTTVLRALTSSESYVVGISNHRPFSPSDPEILGHLDIKRSRLSQISNRLLKHGILQVRPSGRARKYSLTQAARAQLIAWGALKGGEA